jgi:NADH:ubiquinone oxidoreductase subunit K
LYLFLVPTTHLPPQGGAINLILFFGDVNVLLVLFFFSFSTLVTGTSTSLHLLLTAELLWITLYALTLLVGIAHDNLNLISLTFFFLVFSAVEFGIGLVLLLVQHLLTRTLGLDASGNVPPKFSSGTSRTLFVNNLG